MTMATLSCRRPSAQMSGLAAEEDEAKGLATTAVCELERNSAGRSTWNALAMVEP